MAGLLKKKNDYGVIHAVSEGPRILGQTESFVLSCSPYFIGVVLNSCSLGLGIETRVCLYCVVEIL